MREALQYEKLPGSRVRCHVCQWRCVINPGRVGVCRVRENRDGVLYTTTYGEVSSVAVDPIEKKPLFHFYPGTPVFSVGGWGCNFHCLHCQNWEIACTETPSGSRYLSPEEQVRLAVQQQAAGIAWTYNEPTVWYEYTLDCARLAKERGLYTVYVTNGFMTSEALDGIGPWLDAWRVDVKGFSDQFYGRLANVRGWRGILDVAVRARNRWNMHVEVVTNVIPGWNDDEAQLQGIAHWIAGELGELTPWHVTRFFPMHKLQDVAPTPLPTIARAVEIGHAAGLKFVYSGNVSGRNDDTVCYSCGRTAIRRAGYRAEIVGLKGSACAYCGADLNVRGVGLTGGLHGGGHPAPRAPGEDE
ncbi:MAG: AmmeMemoRadiSam system radical SAM enzyme [Dehalococcoidia bacterium]|nr:AmmeMemoRadiSam system radical SAM enzyme [Dehalococcoidia bacterium]